jgi:hypothetical protein
VARTWRIKADDCASVRAAAACKDVASETENAEADSASFIDRSSSV